MSLKPEEIDRLLKQLHDRLTDGFLRFEALRVTLEQSGLSHDLFEQNLKTIQERWEISLAKYLVRTLEDENRELMRLLLELHDGTKQ